MRSHPVLSAFAVAALALGVLPTVALGLAMEPVDLVAEHGAHDERLGEIAERPAEPSRIAATDVEDGARGVRYRVRPGDSLATIAAEHGLDGLDDWRLLYDANPDIEHPDLVEPGTTIRIPEPGERLARRDLPAPVATVARRGAAASGDVWWRLAACESGGRNRVSSNGLYYGYFQFLPATWHSVGGTGLPTQHGYGEQVRRAQILQARAGWGQWPACARVLGLR